MENPIKNSDRSSVSLRDFKRELSRRREEAGPIDIPRNSGNRRTKTKRALLAALAKLGATW